MSKGHAFINGEPLGRYLVASGRKSIGPISSLALPPSWLDDAGAAELTIFDEHGMAPSRVRVVTG